MTKSGASNKVSSSVPATKSTFKASKTHHRLGPIAYGILFPRLIAAGSKRYPYTKDVVSQTVDFSSKSGAFIARVVQQGHLAIQESAYRQMMASDKKTLSLAHVKQASRDIWSNSTMRTENERLIDVAVKAFDDSAADHAATRKKSRARTDAAAPADADADAVAAGASSDEAEDVEE